MAFVALQFMETDEVGIISKSWLVDQTACKWPPYEDKMLIKRAVLEKKAPESSWESRSIFILGVHKTYAGAKKEVENALQSDSDGDNKTEEPKRLEVQSVLHSSIISNPSSPTVVVVKSECLDCNSPSQLVLAPDNSIKSLSASSQCDNSTVSSDISCGIEKTQQKPSSSVISTKAKDSSSHLSSQKNSFSKDKEKSQPNDSLKQAKSKVDVALDMSSYDSDSSEGDSLRHCRKRRRPVRYRSSEEGVSNPGSEPLSSSKNQRVQNSSKNGCDLTSVASEEANLEFRHKVITQLEDLKQQLKEIRSILNQFVKGGVVTSLPSDCPEFPINCQDGMQELNSFLEIKENFTEISFHFGSIGGTDTKVTVRRILQSLMTNDLSMSYNWKGIGGVKLEFSQYSNIVKLILVSVRMHASCHSATRHEVESCIKKWLMHAKDRCGGRSAR